MVKPRRFVLLVVVLFSIVLFFILSYYHISFVVSTINIQNSHHGMARQIGVAMQGYHDLFGCFPPTYSTDESGRRIHSWRILLGPYYLNDQLIECYDLSEPWSSQHNKSYVSLMRNPYRHPYGSEDKTTMFVAVVGENTAFPNTDTRRLSEMAPYTGLIVEVENSGIPWTEPRDISVDEFVDVFKQWRLARRSLWNLIKPVGKGPAVLFADGRVRRLTEDMTEQEVRDLFKVPPDPNAPPPKIWE